MFCPHGSSKACRTLGPPNKSSLNIRCWWGISTVRLWWFNIKAITKYFFILECSIRIELTLSSRSICSVKIHVKNFKTYILFRNFCSTFIQYFIIIISCFNITFRELKEHPAYKAAAAVLYWSLDRCIAWSSPAIGWQRVLSSCCHAIGWHLPLTGHCHRCWPSPSGDAWPAADGINQHCGIGCSWHAQLKYN